MKLKLVSDKNEGLLELSLTDLTKQLLEGKDQFVYLDSSNAEKDIKKLLTTLKKKNESSYIKKIKYGLNDKEYIYQLHVI